MRSSLPRAVGAVLTAALLPLCVAAPALAGTTPVAPADPVTGVLVRDPVATELRISGPDGLVSPGVHRIDTRLLADGEPVRDAAVRLERRTGDAWQEVTTARTDGNGFAVAQVALGVDATLRAVHDASQGHRASRSREIVVDVATFRQQAVRIAGEQKGKPYRYGATGPNSFDCSGFVQYVYRQVGKSLPRTSRQQRAATPHVSRADKQPGDLIFISTRGRVTHVGIYAGDDRFWVAPKAGDVVKLQRIYTSAYTVGRVG